MVGASGSARPGGPRAVPLPRLRLTDEELDAAVQAVLDDPHGPDNDLVEITEVVDEVVREWAASSFDATEKRVKAALEKRGWTFDA